MNDHIWKIETFETPSGDSPVDEFIQKTDSENSSKRTGDFLKKIKKGGMTQKDVTEKMGTKQSAIARLESGDVNPSLEFLQKIAQVMGYKLSIRLTK